MSGKQMQMQNGKELKGLNQLAVLIQLFSSETKSRKKHKHQFLTIVPVSSWKVTRETEMMVSSQTIQFNYEKEMLKHWLIIQIKTS